MTIPPEIPVGLTNRDAKVAWASDLPARAASGLVLALAALVVAWVGGPLFVVLWSAAAAAIFWEWARLAAPGNWLMLAAGIAGLAVVGMLTLVGAYGPALVAAAISAAIAAWCASTQRPLWAAAGVFYAGIAIMPPSVLRADQDYGLRATLLLFAVVWTTDICGYFIGRLADGPKLWRVVSPNKTWAGAVGGLVGAMIAGLAVGWFARLPHLVATALLALALSIAAQAGDLVESAFKRRFGVKDVSHLIPGHGGLMDRLDGFLAAALLAAVIGVARGGVDGAARGLLIW